MQVWSLARGGNVDFGRVCTIPRKEKRDSRAQAACATWFMPNPCFPSGPLQLGVSCAECAHPQLPGEPRALADALHVFTPPCCGTRYQLHVSTERRPLKLQPGFVRILPRVPAPCADLAWDPFTAVKLSHGSHCHLSLMSAPRELPRGLQLCHR